MSDLNLHQRLLAITRDAGALEKSGQTSYGDQYKYHKIDDVVDRLRPLFVEHGVALLVHVDERYLSEAGKTSNGKTQWRADLLLNVSFVNADKPEEREAISAWGDGIDTGDKAVGKAYAYALKNVLLATFFLRGQPDVEEDHEEATSPPSAPAAVDDKHPSGTPSATALAELKKMGESIGLTIKEIGTLSTERFNKKPPALAQWQFKELWKRVETGSWPADDIDEAIPEEAA
jgi:hypothetical protein